VCSKALYHTIFPPIRRPLLSFSFSLPQTRPCHLWTLWRVDCWLVRSCDGWWR
jgi:hypothetical protein